MLNSIKTVALLGLVFTALSCEDAAIKPRPTTGSTSSQAIKAGQPIINPVPGTEQRPGNRFEFFFGHGPECRGLGICYVKVHVLTSSIVSYPVAGQGTGFFSAPVNVNPETHVGTMRIIFTQALSKEQVNELFDLTGEGTVLTLEKPGALGADYSQLTLLPDLYKTIPGNGTDQNPYGYVDVAVRCE